MLCMSCPLAFSTDPTARIKSNAQDLLSDLNEFETLCQELGRKQSEFVDDCRWHLDHYPHFLGRRPHFVSYAQYIKARKGPLTVRRPQG